MENKIFFEKKTQIFTNENEIQQKEKNAYLRKKKEIRNHQVSNNFCPVIFQEPFYSKS